MVDPKKMPEKSDLHRPKKDEVKVVVVGNGAVGKTALVSCYVQDSFPSGYIPTVFDAHRGTLTMKEKQRTLIIWDTAGQEDMNSLRKLSYPHTNCFLVCFSLADKGSFKDALTTWRDELDKFAPKHVPRILVGLKKDLRDERKS